MPTSHTEMKIPKQEIDQIWYIKNRKCYSNDISAFYKILMKVAKSKRFYIKTLGKTQKLPIFLLTKRINKKNKNVLIAAGFHGDEPAGCWAILDFLEKARKKELTGINLSFLPLINPTGFKLGQLRNIFNENLNRNFYNKNKSDKLSVEGKILVKNISVLKKLAKDCCLTLHEDYDQNKFYVYIKKDKKIKDKFYKEIIKTASKFFKILKEGKADRFKVKNGVIFWKFSDSFEQYLFDKGILRVACTETPRNSKIEKRIDATSSIINSLINFLKLDNHKL